MTPKETAMSLKRIITLASGDAGDSTALAFGASLAGQADGPSLLLAH